jgi:hypothetical protein
VGHCCSVAFNQLTCEQPCGQPESMSALAQPRHLQRHTQKAIRLCVLPLSSSTVPAVGYPVCPIHCGGRPALGTNSHVLRFVACTMSLVDAGGSGLAAGGLDISTSCSISICCSAPFHRRLQQLSLLQCVYNGGPRLSGAMFRRVLYGSNGIVQEQLQMGPRAAHSRTRFDVKHSQMLTSSTN